MLEFRLNILLIFSGFIIAYVAVLFYERKIKLIKTRLICKEHNKNKIHFYVARDKNSLLYLYLGKPKRADFSFIPCKNGYCIISKSDFQKFDLNPNDFKNLKWEDEPVEVFVNMEDL